VIKNRATARYILLVSTFIVKQARYLEPVITPTSRGWLLILECRISDIPIVPKNISFSSHRAAPRHEETYQNKKK
jgi:hypothetical protein